MSCRNCGHRSPGLQSHGTACPAATQDRTAAPKAALTLKVGSTYGVLQRLAARPRTPRPGHSQSRRGSRWWDSGARGGSRASRHAGRTAGHATRRISDARKRRRGHGDAVAGDWPVRWPPHPGDAGARRRAVAPAAGRNRFRRRRHSRHLCRYPARDAQRPARPAGIADRGQGQPARSDDDRAGRDAVRFRLRDQGSARQHEGAGRKAADSGAEGGDARRSVLFQEIAPVAAVRQCTRARRHRLVADDGSGGPAVQEGREARASGTRRVHRRHLPVRRVAQGPRGISRRGGKDRRGDDPGERGGGQSTRPA